MFQKNLYLIRNEVKTVSIILLVWTSLQFTFTKKTHNLMFVCTFVNFHVFCNWK